MIRDANSMAFWLTVIDRPKYHTKDDGRVKYRKQKGEGAFLRFLPGVK